MTWMNFMVQQKFSSLNRTRQKPDVETETESLAAHTSFNRNEMKMWQTLALASADIHVLNGLLLAQLIFWHVRRFSVSKAKIRL